MDLPDTMDTLEDGNNIVDQALVPSNHNAVSPIPEQIIPQERKDFTSEIYKIEIKNLAKFGFGVCIMLTLISCSKKRTSYNDMWCQISPLL